MSKLENSIGWCDDTGNKVIGCTKVSEGCKNCYAEVGTVARVLRARADNPIETWGAGGTRIAVGDFTAKLRRLNKLCICDRCHETATLAALGLEHGRRADGECGGEFRRIRLFADSNSDWLDEAWPIETLAEFLDEIRRSPNVDVLLLTKRMENWTGRLEAALKIHQQNDNFAAADWIIEWLAGTLAPANVWLGVSVENQKRADERIPLLVQTPAAVRFLSCEPLLEELDIVGPFGGPQAFPLGMAIQWVIVGGESGKDRRDCGMEAIASVVRQCRVHECPVYVKQDGAFKSGQQGRLPEEIWGMKQFPKDRGCVADQPQHGQHAATGPVDTAAIH